MAGILNTDSESKSEVSFTQRKSQCGMRFNMFSNHLLGYANVLNSMRWVLPFEYVHP